MVNQNNYNRIVFLTGSMGKGGAERVISILANSYATKGWQVDILLLLDDCCEYQLNKQVKLIPIYDKNKSRIEQVPKWIFGIRKYVSNQKPNIIVSFFSRINIITLLSCLGLKKRIIISERSDPKSDGRSFIVKLTTYFLYPLSNKIVFQTKWAQSNFSNRIQQKSIIIQNPIQIKVEALKNKKKKIVAVGRLSKEKNHGMLIQAFKEVHDKYPDYELYIYGEGKLRETLEFKIQELNLLNSVFLPGNAKDVHEKIADAEIFIHPSNHEGMSNALLEAMMMGLTCITTDYPGSNEVIRNDYNGVIVKRGDEKQLSRKICELIEDKEKGILLGENARKSVQKMSLKNIFSIWEKYLELDTEK